MPYMYFRSLNTTLKAVILEASKNTKSAYFSILVSYKYQNDNMTHIYSSKVILNMSITLILMFRILPYMIYLKSLVKILLPVTDLNIAYKTQKTSKYTRNSDFSKKPEIRAISTVLARHTPSSFTCVLLYYTTIYHNNLNPPPPRYTLFSQLNNLCDYLQRCL